MKNEKTQNLVLCAVMVALATVLSILKIYEAPLGGSVTLFSMVPIFIIGFLRGPKWGLASAFVYSVLQLILGLKSVSYVPSVSGIILCVLFDYIIAFLCLGVTGFFKIDKDTPNKTKYMKVIFGVLLACVLRYICHVLSGAVVWYEITKEGGWNDLVNKVGMWAYSLIYNAQFMVPETIMCVVATPVIIYVLNIFGKKKSA